MRISRILKGLVYAAVLYLGFEASESIIANKAAYAQEAVQEDLQSYRKKLGIAGWRKGAVDRLTPDLYRRDSDEFERQLRTLKDFLWKREKFYGRNNAVLFEQDKKEVLEALAANLSLNGDSLAHSMQTSEEIRQLLVREGELDFKKRLEDILDDVSYETEMIKAYERFCNNSRNSTNPEVKENIKAAHELIKLRKDYRAFLQQKTESLKQIMFLLRWHYPSDLKGEIDSKEVYKKCRETLAEISQLSKAWAERNFYGIAKHLEGHAEKQSEAHAVFERNLNLVRGQGETQIQIHVLGQPLRKISYDGRLFFATREFADYWEGKGGVTEIAQQIEKPKVAKTSEIPKQPQRIVRKPETQPPKPPEITPKPKQPEQPQRVPQPTLELKCLGIASSYAVSQDGLWVAAERADEIYLVNSSTLLSTNISNHPSSDTCPSISADGTRIVFVSGRDGDEEIYFYDARTKHLRRIAPNPKKIIPGRFSVEHLDWHPQISGNGRKAVFQSRRSRIWQIYIYDLDSHILAPVEGRFNSLRQGGEGTQPAISYNGSQVAIVSVMGIYLNEKKVVDREDIRSGNISMSADARRIVFQGIKESTTPKIYLADTVTGIVREISDRQGYFPSISPDGTKVAFISSRNGNEDIFLKHLDTGKLEQITEGLGDDWYPLLSNNSIFFKSGKARREESKLYMKSLNN